MSEAQICEIVGCSPQRRQQWVGRELLDAAGSKGCGLRDALALAQLLKLIEVLGPSDGVVAWAQVRKRLCQPFAAEIVDVIYDSQLKSAVVGDKNCDVRTLIAHGRPVRLVELGPRRREITEAVRRVEEAGAAAAAPSRRARRPRPRSSRRAPGDAG